MGFVGSMASYKIVFQFLQICHHLGYAGGDFLACFSSSPHFIFVLCESWCVGNVRSLLEDVLQFVKKFVFEFRFRRSKDIINLPPEEGEKVGTNVTMCCMLSRVF